ncbi:9074_t:CDS:2 [Dentiscutata erythropus]|uniref:9074_t:CDS:1 n=1 Tax=Dentiscutata erythropus TaxID=1348616 RepID=A0A9N9NFV3_9GLOM|nr:9074_t:CDS:2 [Dentiscutata erythropus]
MVEFLKLEYYKRWSEKVAIAIIILELRVYARNNSTENSLNTVGNISDVMVANATCTYQPSYVRLNNIKDENLAFIFFQIFQVWFCFSAMYNQNSMQVIAIVVLNFLFALNGIIQWVEVKKWFIDFEEDCPGRLPLHTQFVKYDMPLIIALFAFSIAMAFLCWKLYRQYGWNIYKRIGADVNMQTNYRTYLIYILLLKLDAMFILGLSVEALNVYVYTMGKLSDLKHLRYMPEQFYIFHLIVTVCIGINQILAYYSTTLVWSIFVFGNFNSGLKEILIKSPDQADEGLLNNRHSKRFSIDDD